MRRRAPRPLSAALQHLGHRTAPQTVLARVQAAWVDVVGPAVAAEAEPVGERAGTIVVACRSASWANELELLAPDLLERLNCALEETGGGRVEGLRAKVGRSP